MMLVCRIQWFVSKEIVCFFVSLDWDKDMSRNERTVTSRASLLNIHQDERKDRKSNVSAGDHLNFFHVDASRFICLGPSDRPCAKKTLHLLSRRIDGLHG